VRQGAPSRSSNLTSFPSKRASTPSRSPIDNLRISSIIPTRRTIRPTLKTCKSRCPCYLSRTPCRGFLPLSHSELHVGRLKHPHALPDALLMLCCRRRIHHPHSVRRVFSLLLKHLPSTFVWRQSRPRFQSGIWKQSQKLLHPGRPAEQNVWLFAQGRRNTIQVC
jgi:hypothetical protein